MQLRSLWLRVLGLCLSGMAAVLACGGPEFSASGSAGRAGSGASAGTGTGGAMAGEGGEASGTGGSSATGGASGGSGGTAGGVSAGSGGSGGGTSLCTEAADCDDQNPCTIDSCAQNGVCERMPKCTGAQPLCCEGVCGECCMQADCEDNVSCTDDVCFAGFCTNTPNDECGDDQYCGPTGCMDREQCGMDQPCDDSNPCTTDTCVGGFCDYVLCAQGGDCCPGVGCGACCIDAQCGAAEDDPCTLHVCEGGQCHAPPRCDDGELCCPSSDGLTATCGQCCGASDCPAPTVPCLKAVCAGTCTMQVIPGVCADDETCDPKDGCIGGADCNDPADCQMPTDPCDTVTCSGGACEYREVSCSNGLLCCSNAGGSAGQPPCRECCDSLDCSSGSDSGSLCCPNGACQECCVDTDCGQVMGGGGSTPQGGGIIPGTCDYPVCLEGGACGTRSLCRQDELCCNGVCQPIATPCVDPGF